MTLPNSRDYLTEFESDGSNDPFKPTVIPNVSIAGIRISGQIVQGDPDYFYVKIPEGTELEGLWLEDYQSTDTIAFYALQSGKVFSAGEEVNKMITWDHLSATAKGTDLLGNLPSPKISDFVIWIQQTGALTDYSLIITFAPKSENPISGKPVSELIMGTDAAEVINADQGNDTILSSLRADSIDGGEGVDIVFYEKLRNDYEILKLWDGKISIDEVKSPGMLVPQPPSEGEDQLIHIERIKFNDSALAFDSKGAAGNAARLILTMFGDSALNDPALAGILIYLFDQGFTHEEITRSAMPYAFGVDASHESILNKVWNNLSSDPPNEEIIRSIVRALEWESVSGGFGIEDVVVQASNLYTTELAIELSGIWNTGLTYAPWNE